MSDSGQITSMVLPPEVVSVAFTSLKESFAAPGSMISNVSGGRNATGLMAGALVSIVEVNSKTSKPALFTEALDCTKPTFTSPGATASRCVVRNVGAPGSVFCSSRYAASTIAPGGSLKPLVRCSDQMSNSFVKTPVNGSVSVASIFTASPSPTLRLNFTLSRLSVVSMS